MKDEIKNALRLARAFGGYAYSGNNIANGMDSGGPMPPTPNPMGMMQGQPTPNPMGMMQGQPMNNQPGNPGNSFGQQTQNGIDGDPIRDMGYTAPPPFATLDNNLPPPQPVQAPVPSSYNPLMSNTPPAPMADGGAVSDHEIQELLDFPLVHYAEGGAVEEALEKTHGEHAIPFHQAIARSGYEDGGHVSDAEIQELLDFPLGRHGYATDGAVEADVAFAPEDKQFEKSGSVMAEEAPPVMPEAEASPIQHSHSWEHLPLRPYGTRYNEETHNFNTPESKDIGFYGPVSVGEGDHVASEYSRGSDIGQYPSIAADMPEDLKVQALNAARFDAPVPEEADKFAYNKAAERKAAGRSPFYEPGKDPYPKWSPDQYWEKPAIMPDVPKKEYKPFGVLPFKEDESGIHFDPNAGLLGPITRGLKIAHQAAPKLLGGEGRFDIDNPEDFKAVQDLAGLAMTGSLAGTKPSGALSSGISRPEKPLMAVHNLSLNNLYKGTQAGGLPAPSVAIKDTTSPFNKFGEVSLIGGKEFSEPNRDLNVFGGDAYTPSVWSSSEDANKIAKDLARQSPRVIPEHVADPNTLIAHNIPEFKTLEEIKNASHLLTDEQKAKAAQDLFDSYVAEDLQSRMPKIKPSRGSQHQDEEYQYWQSLVDAEKRKQHYPNLSPEMQEEIESLPELVRQLPQEYFESKYKGVANSQYNPLAPSFKGAIVPVQDLAESRRLLKKLGIPDIIPIDANDPEARLKAYEQFKHLHFADGGEVEGEVSAAPDDISTENFLHKELKGSAPQYDPEGGLNTAREGARFAAGLTTPGAIADAAGYLGGPSILENIGQGNYGTAALQAAGAIPFVGPLAKAGAGAHMAISMVPKSRAVEDALNIAEKANKSSELNPLLAIHQIPGDKLQNILKLNSLPLPSMAITNPNLIEHMNYGDINLVGKKHFSEPTADNRIFGGDVYTPIFPNVERGKFYSYPQQKKVPVTSENVTEHMLSYPIRGGKRSFPHAPKYYSDYNRPIGLGIEAVPEFKSFQEMSNQRGRLGLRPELLRDPLHHEEKTFWELYRLLGKYRPKGLGEEENLINMVKAASTGDFKKFYPEVPEEIISKANEAVKNLQNKKVLYFEAAPRRSVDFNEFAGAIVPKNKMKSVAPRLKKIGLESIPYDDYDESLGEVMLRNFKDYSFAKGGKAKTNALQSKALKVANK